jgi:hypothetical protein
VSKPYFQVELAKTKTDWNWRYTERHKYSKDDPKENFGP